MHITSLCGHLGIELIILRRVDRIVWAPKWYPSDGSIRKAALSSWCLLQQWVHCLEVGVKGNQLGTLVIFFSVAMEKDPFFLWGRDPINPAKIFFGWFVRAALGDPWLWGWDHFNNPPAWSSKSIDSKPAWWMTSWKYQNKIPRRKLEISNLAIHKDSETHFQGSMFFQLLSSFKIATEFLWWKKRIKDWSPSTKWLPRTCSHHLWLLQQHLCTNSSVVSLRHTHGGFWRGVIGSNLGPKTPGWILD